MKIFSSGRRRSSCFQEKRLVPVEEIRLHLEEDILRPGEEDLLPLEDEEERDEDAPLRFARSLDPDVSFLGAGFADTFTEGASSGGSSPAPSSEAVCGATSVPSLCSTACSTPASIAAPSNKPATPAPALTPNATATGARMSVHNSPNPVTIIPFFMNYLQPFLREYSTSL